MSEFQVGQILVHSEMPESGRLKVEWITNEQVGVILESKNGGETKSFRLPNAHLKMDRHQTNEGFGGAKVKAKSSKKKAGQRSLAPSLPFEDAHKRFLAIYPKGFEDPGYLKDEREYKEKALSRWNEHFSPAGLADLKAKADGSAVAHAFGEVFSVIALMHIPGEWIPFHNAVKASPLAVQLAEAYAEVVREGQFTEANFKQTLAAFDAIGQGKPKWTVFTYWPYVASSTGFAFVKPTLIKAAAAGMGISLNYEPAANWLTYSQAFALYEELWKRLQPLGARDWVDVQSFLWLGWKA